MDTFCTITVVSSSEEEARKAIEAGFDEIKRLEQLLNFFSPDSELSAINKNAGLAPVRVSAETLDVMKKAVELADSTGGAFDPAVGPLMRLWGFSNKAAKLTVPSEAKIKNLLAAIDYKKIKVDISKSEIYLQEKGMEIDLGGIAKGYAADRVIEVIRSQGIKAALAAIAGDIKGFGLKPDLQGWKVGIQNPRPTGVRSIRLIGVDSYRDSEGQVDATRLRGSRVKEEDIFATLSLKDSAISTSGDYQRYFMENGKRFHHILDPQTGYPAHGVISVSIIAPDGYMTDGLSTGVFVLGVEKGIRLLESMGIDGIIVDTENKISVTKNLEGKINIGNL